MTEQQGAQSEATQQETQAPVEATEAQPAAVEASEAPAVAETPVEEAVAEKFDVKNTKEVLVLAFGIGGALKKAKADGKLDAMDMVYLIPVLDKVGPALDDINLVYKELKDLDSYEGKELLALAAEQLPQVTDKAELVLKINKGLAAMIALMEFVAVL